MLQDKKVRPLRLRQMIFGRKSEKRKKADSEPAKDEEKKNDEKQDEEKKDEVGNTDAAAKDQVGTVKKEKSKDKASVARKPGHGRIPMRARIRVKS